LKQLNYVFIDMFTMSKLHPEKFMPLSQILNVCGYVDEVMDQVDDLRSRVDLIEQKKRGARSSDKLIESLIIRVDALEHELKSVKTIVFQQQDSLDSILEKMLEDECDALLGSII